MKVKNYINELAYLVTQEHVEEQREKRRIGRTGGRVAGVSVSSSQKFDVRKWNAWR